jgi:hypothetical protein
MGMEEACPGRREEIPVDARVPLNRSERFSQTKECIDNLSPAECIDEMLTGNDRDHVPLPEREEIRECHTLSPNDPAPIRKSWGYKKYLFRAEWAAIGIIPDNELLIEMAVQASRADPAPEAGKMLLPVLQVPRGGSQFGDAEHIASGIYFPSLADIRLHD